MNDMMNEKQEKKEIDNFWLGFVPAITIPFVIILAGIMNNTGQDFWFVMNHLIVIIKNGGISRLTVGILPNLILLFLFYALKKERAIGGAFVGTVPYLLLLFWVF